MASRSTIKGDALTPVPTGKQKVVRARDELWRRVDRDLAKIEELARNGVNTLADIRKEASWARRDQRKTSWGKYGAEQGNPGRHIDALAGVVYGYMEAIELLDEVLGDDSITRRNIQGGKDQGQEQQEASDEAEGEAVVEDEGQGPKPSPVEREIKRSEANIAQARKGRAKRSGATTPAKRGSKGGRSRATARGKDTSA